MSGGICFLILSVHKLFDLSIDSTCYLYVVILCNVCLSMFLFLGLLPQNKKSIIHVRYNIPFQWCHPLPVSPADRRLSDSTLHLCTSHIDKLGTPHRMGFMVGHNPDDRMHRN